MCQEFSVQENELMYTVGEKGTGKILQQDISNLVSSVAGNSSSWHICAGKKKESCPVPSFPTHQLHLSTLIPNLSHQPSALHHCDPGTSLNPPTHLPHSTEALFGHHTKPSLSQQAQVWTRLPVPHRRLWLLVPKALMYCMQQQRTTLTRQHLPPPWSCTIGYLHSKQELLLCNASVLSVAPALQQSREMH